MSDLAFDRRTLIALASAAAVMPSGGVTTTPAGRSVDLGDPEQNLRAYIRMRGDLTGKTVVERVEARSFGVIEHKLPQPLFGSLGIQVSRFLPSAEGFVFRYKYFSLATDLSTGKPIAELANPYTGKRNAIPPRTTAPGEILLTTRGWQFTKKPNDAATQTNPGVVRPWSHMGDALHLTDTLISPPNYETQPAFQLFTYMSPWGLATDPGRASAPSGFAGTGMEDWRDWMAMGDAKLDGSLAVHMTGRKVAGPADFPDWLIAAARTAMPKLFDAF